MNRTIRAVIMAASLMTCALGVAAVATVASMQTARAGETQGGMLNVSAIWQTTWGPEVCQLTLQQSGSSITGGYVTSGAPPGRVGGQLVGNVMTGQWTDAGGSVGGMRLVFSPDGRSFVGTWGSGGSIDNGGDWNGHR